MISKKYKEIILKCFSFLGLLLLPLALIAMEESNEPVVYFRDLEKTASENDEYQAMFAQESVFIQLVVQASKSKRDNKKPFQYRPILCKNRIKHHKSVIAVCPADVVQ